MNVRSGNVLYSADPDGVKAALALPKREGKPVGSPHPSSHAAIVDHRGGRSTASSRAGVSGVTQP
jgi:hypothetical protein